MSFPESSLAAYRNMVASGECEKHKSLILGVIKTEGAGWTAHQIAFSISEKLGQPFTNAQVTRRVNELEASGLIHRGVDMVNCPITGRLMTTWYPGKSPI